MFVMKDRNFLHMATVLEAVWNYFKQLPLVVPFVFRCVLRVQNKGHKVH
jgi:hypothetical protein